MGLHRGRRRLRAPARSIPRSTSAKATATTARTSEARLRHRPSCGPTRAIPIGWTGITTGLRVRVFPRRMSGHLYRDFEVASGITAATSLSLMPRLTPPHGRPSLRINGSLANDAEVRDVRPQAPNTLILGRARKRFPGRSAKPRGEPVLYVVSYLTVGARLRLTVYTSN